MEIFGIESETLITSILTTTIVAIGVHAIKFVYVESKKYLSKKKQEKKEKEQFDERERRIEKEFLLSDKNMLTIAFVKLSMGLIAYLFAYGFCLAAYFAFLSSDSIYEKILWIIFPFSFFWFIFSKSINKLLASRLDLLNEVYEIHKKNIKADLNKETSE